MKKNEKCGIYCIVNVVDNKQYVGSSVEISKRRRAHFNMLNKNRHHSQYLQNAYNYRGFDNFIFEIIEECKESVLVEREQHYMDTLRPIYNMSKIAGRTEMTEEVRFKMSVAALGRPSAFKGRKHSVESRWLIKHNHADCKGKNGAFFGKKHTEETKKILSEGKLGEKHCFYGKKRPDHSEQMMGEKNPFYDKKHTEEYKSNSSILKSKLSLENMSLVLNLASKGSTQSQLAVMFSCSITSINRVVNYKIMVLRRIKELYSHNKATIEEISEMFNVSMSTVSSIVNNSWKGDK